MHLFYVSESFISSLELPDTMHRGNDGIDVVQCYSSATLLNTAGKLVPDVVVIDFVLLDEDQTAFFKDLRAACPEAKIIVLVERDDYNNLLMSIEQGGIDEYLVKPVARDDFIARLQQGSRIIITAEESEPDLAGNVIEIEQEVSDIFSFPVDNTEKTAGGHEIAEEELFSVESEEEFSLDLLSGEPAAAPETGNRFTAIFGDEQPEKKKEVESMADELHNDDLLYPEAETVIPDLPQDEVYDNDLEAQEQDLEDLFYDGDNNIFTTEPLPGENTEEELKAELFIEPPPLEDDLYQYQQNLKYGTSQLRKGRKTSRKNSSGSRIVKLLSLLGNALLVCVLIVMALISVILILDRISESVPQVGGYQVYVIKSDYFSPEVTAGSLAVGRTADLEQINAGDIITYRSADDPAVINAGRVARIHSENGLSQLDVSGAVAGGERQSVKPEAVIGRLVYAVPYVGHLVDYAQTREGLILLIFVPGILIIIFQMSKIIKYFYGRQ